MAKTEAHVRKRVATADELPELSDACRNELRILLDAYCPQAAVREALLPELVSLMRSELLGYEELIIRIDRAAVEVLTDEVLRLQERLARRWWPW
jgi:hypothetical protein